MTKTSVTLLLSSLIISQVIRAADTIVADFEKDTYDGWKVTGTAFGSAPAQGTLPGQMNVEGYLGCGLVNSFVGSDDSTGTLTSPEFTIERKYLSFLIGGGKNEEKLALQLVIDGKVVRTATGPNDKPGGTEALSIEAWEVAEFAGKKATLRIIDEAKGSWGHLNVDHIVQTDTKPAGLMARAERTLAASAKYLHFPIKNGAKRRVVTLFVEGKEIVKNDMELADGEPDWWAPMDVSPWAGKDLTVSVDKLRQDSHALSSLKLADKIADSETLYTEPMRGQFHFSTRRGWINDPNGCVFYNGEYHLFYQHNPYGWAWGNMHWGHAVSKDLVHWEELSDALWPDAMGPMFSGTAVVDWNNTSGFGKDGKPPLILFYTAAGKPTVQGLAYSTDGRTFTKYAGNPILKEITDGNRDPKVFWHEPTKHWVMVLYVELNKVHTMHFFTSKNLKEWTFTSKTDGFFECPEFFELPVDGDTNRNKWVLTAASSEYRVGTFDGEKFTSESIMWPGHTGRDFYAAQTFAEEPKGRRILIGWWRTETKGMTFNQSMSLPLDLKLTQTADGPRVTFNPISELEALRSKTHDLGAMTLKPGDKNPLDAIQADLTETQVEFEPSTAKEVIFNIRDVMVIYDGKKQELSVEGHRSKAPLKEGKQRLTIFRDRIGVEVFASDGLCFVPVPHNANPDNKRLFFEAKGGEAKVHKLTVHELRSAWKK